MFYTAPMHISIKTYIAKDSALHRLDARAKILLMLIMTIGVFALNRPLFLLLFALLTALGVIFSKISFHEFVPYLKPAIVLALFPVIFNGFSFDVTTAQENLMAYYQTDAFTAWAPVALIDTFGLLPAGIYQGFLMGVRILLLVVYSLLFTFTTTSEKTVAALAWFLGPLRALHAPVDDICTVFALALRFIPVVAQDLSTVADAHRMRGAQLDYGPLHARIFAWAQVFIPLFIRLFKRAEKVGTAMDARCYGQNTARKAPLSPESRELRYCGKFCEK